MNSGYDQFISKNGILEIKKNGILVGSGKYNLEFGLLKFDNQGISEANLSLSDRHKRLGHINQQIVK